ncbi:hypothetical protein Glove_256g151 [Diversispora epigaea]|uniref:Uncharacterized protein n=1 Tax=Diversispora epigaea TaxID=1348612 RepID=A0A397I7A7_9GLOM|nr:hypothetical protein Glove_256g151 [Diversispora epigaea]
MWIKRKLLQSATTPETIVTIELSLPFKKKKKPLIFTIQSATTSESIETIPSTQKKDGSFEINEKITKELDVTSSNEFTTSAQNIAAKDELKSVDPSVWKLHLLLEEESDETEDSDDDLDEMDWITHNIQFT